MAMRSKTTYLRSVLSRLAKNSTFATSTTPKMKAHAPATDFGSDPATHQRLVKGEFVPVYVAIGMILLSLGFGINTATHQLMRAPNVFVRKSRRETLPEVVEPERAVEDGEKFITKSFFRKVAHIQEFDRQDIMPDPIRGDVFARQPQPRAVTLKDVGVEPVLPKPYQR